MDSLEEQLHSYSRDEIIALIRDFVPGLDANQQSRFLGLVARGPRARATESEGVGSVGDLAELLDRIQTLHDDLAADRYVEYGSGFDPEYGDYRGFGDDSWIDTLDELFAEVTRFLGAGRYADAVAGYLALFDIFGLAEDGFHFTRPDPVAALNTDVDLMKANLFVAIGRSDPHPASTAIEVSEDISWYGQNQYALLDAWQSQPALLDGLEAALIDLARQPVRQDAQSVGMSRLGNLLRELYRRYRTPADYATLCREIGVQQGWPYVDLVRRYQGDESWHQVLGWADEGLARLPSESRYRIALREARGQALIRLERPREAVDELLPLFAQEPTTSIYLLLRDAARAVGHWKALYPQVTTDLRQRVLADVQRSSYATAAKMQAALLGFAYLLERDWQTAIAWALTPTLPAGWRDDDTTRTVAAGLVSMGLSAKQLEPDEVLAQELLAAPTIIRENQSALELAAHALPGDALLSEAILAYERIVERSVAGRNRTTYAAAGKDCAVIRSIYRAQGRLEGFDRYYQGLFTTYNRLPAFKDELSKAIEGSGYRRKR